MAEQVQKISLKAGLPPGTLVHVGNRKSEKVKITVFDYSPSGYEEYTYEDVKDCFGYRDSETTTWINIDGLHDLSVISAVGEHFGLHPLLLEDILNTKHRPKFEEFENYVAVSLKMLGLSENRDKIVSEQISIVLGENWVISFQEQEGDIFDAFRDRIRDGKGLIRKRNSDYLLYRLLDTVVDNYFFVTEYFNEATEALEEQVIQGSDVDGLQEIQKLKKQLISFRKSVYPVREAISGIQKDTTNLIKPITTPYFQDVYEHVIQILESIETQRDLLANIMDLYLSGLSNKTNQVMQVLTIIATIFIPLTFVAGIYGMNFEYMPELKWKYGYFGVWTIMLIMIVFMIFYFRRKRWL